MTASVGDGEEATGISYRCVGRWRWWWWWWWWCWLYFVPSSSSLPLSFFFISSICSLSKSRLGWAKYIFRHHDHITGTELATFELPIVPWSHVRWTCFVNIDCTRQELIFNTNLDIFDLINFDFFIFLVSSSTFIFLFYLFFLRF